MANILDQLADYARIRVAQSKELVPLEEMKERALALPGGGGRFEQALRDEIPAGRPGAGDSIHFICECKKASPSKGLIAPEFPYVEIARSYETAGASCISCLTEPKWFLGSNQYLEDIVREVSIPVIRKDFTVDEYMIYEARVMGASAVLLICAILDTETIARYIGICDALGLTALVEAHDEAEVASAAAAGARVIGVNNRNLKDFTVDIHNSVRLRQYAPDGTIFVAESGIKTAGDVQVLRENGVNGVLVGETLMRAADRGAELRRLRGVYKKNNG